jgi:glycosyltransferase involved in cell wall biosynthesis
MEQPLVSVYITTKNRRKLLERSLKSVITQTYRNLEIIIVDDGSNYDIKQILNSIDFKGIKYILLQNQRSIGACASRNKAMKIAKGKFITGLDDDDFFHPTRISVLLENYSPFFSCVSSNFFYFHKNGSITRNSFIGRIIKKSDLFNVNCIGSQVLAERKRFLKVGGFDETLKASQDLDLWIRLIEEFGPAKRIRFPLYYMDVDNTRYRISSSNDRIEGTQQIINKYYQ